MRPAPAGHRNATAAKSSASEVEHEPNLTVSAQGNQGQVSPRRRGGNPKAISADERISTLKTRVKFRVMASLISLDVPAPSSLAFLRASASPRWKLGLQQRDTIRAHPSNPRLKF